MSGLMSTPGCRYAVPAKEMSAMPTLEQEAAEVIRIVMGNYVTSMIEVPYQPPLALLLAGSDPRFAASLSGLHECLEKAGCTVVSKNLVEDVEGSLEILKQFVADADGFRPLLLVFNGHGSKRGWEGSKKKPTIYYRNVAKILKDFDGPLFVINDTCYGLELLPYLWKERHPTNTGFVAPWNGHNINRGGPVRDICEAWSMQKTPEELHGEMRVISTDLGEYHASRLQRWGARYDHLFFRPEAYGGTA